MMTTSDDISRIAKQFGDPARAAILCALMDGKEKSAKQLAGIANVSANNLSNHLKNLKDANLVNSRRVGRRKLISLSDRKVAELIENFMRYCGADADEAQSTASLDSFQLARTCYDHLAGQIGVRVCISLMQQNFLVVGSGIPELTETGEQFLADELRVNVAALRAGRRPIAKLCQDVTSDGYHLAGALGKALLEEFIERGWVRANSSDRVLAINPWTQIEFERMFPVSI